MSSITVERLTLDEKLSLLSGQDFWQTRAIHRHQLASTWLADGPHGLRKPARGDSPGMTDAQPATCFPTAWALAASWDSELVQRVGAAIGGEARARGVHVVLGPGLNIKRHPLGGRNFEYLSEDPLLAGTLAAAMVRGIQGQGVGACLKHFVAKNQEDHRMVIDVQVDERSLRELYLKGFEIAVEQSGPYAVMAAYNRITFGQVRSTMLGGLLYRVAVYKAEQLLGAGDDPQRKHLANSAIGEMPLRALASTAGLLSWRLLDALLALLEGRALRRGR